MPYPFQQVDVFTSDTPYLGNPVAVVLDAHGVADDVLQRFARWTNLSETTFLLPPTDSGADYRVRIFTPREELPFAGHPTLGSCHAWLQAGGTPGSPGEVIQECPAGLIRVRSTDDGLAFAAPALIGPRSLDEAQLAHIAAALAIDPGQIVDSQWLDNGLGWAGVLLADADAVLALQPGYVDLDVGVVGPGSPGGGPAFEVRAFFPRNGATVEDPVTGSLNASLAVWLMGTGRAPASYVARQGTALGRNGRIVVSSDVDGTIWVGGRTITCVSGAVEL